jgi:hypothetical protein
MLLTRPLSCEPIEVGTKKEGPPTIPPSFSTAALAYSMNEKPPGVLARISMVAQFILATRWLKLPLHLGRIAAQGPATQSAER